MDLILTLAYLMVAVAAWKHIYVALYRHHRREFPSLTWETGDRVFAVVWGGGVALFWPLALLCYIAYRVVVSVEPLLERLEK